MNDFDFAYLIYLAIIIVVVGSYLLVEYRGRMGVAVQQALIWILLFFALVIVYGFKDTIKQQFYPREGTQISENSISIPRANDGHFYVDLYINDVRVEFLVDTGATEVVLTIRDADRIGIPTADLRFFGTAQTANGEVRTAAITLDDIRFADITDFNLRAYVNEGELDISLLGMRYLSLFSRLEIVDDMMILYR